MMWKLWWPILLSVAAGVLYQVGAKETSVGMHPLAALVVTYLVASVLSLVAYVVMEGKESRVKEVLSFQWAGLGLSLSIVGIELGSIEMYKVGWAMNVAYVVYTTLVVVSLLFVGWLVYKEKLRLSQAAGMAVAMAGVALIIL